MKKIVSLLGAFLILFTLIANAQDNEMPADAAKAYNEGNKMLKAGNYTGAVAKYDEALKTSKDYRIYYQKGVSLRKMNKYDDALTAYNNSLKENPKFAPVYNALGVVYFMKGDYQKAADNFVKFKEETTNKAQKKKADTFIARAYAKIGVQDKNDGRYDAAIKNLTTAVEHDDYDAAYLALAQVYVETGKFDKALEAADKAINNRTSISKGAPYYFKGLAFKGLNEKAKAKENFEISKKDPQYKATSEYELKQLR